MTLLKKIGIITAYALIIVVIVFLVAQLAKLLIKGIGIVGTGFASFITVLLYILGIFAGVWLILWLWDNYGKKYE